MRGGALMPPASPRAQAASREYHRERKKLLDFNEKCPNCLGPKPWYVKTSYCRPCLDVYAFKKRNAYQERITAGLCPRCGGPRDCEHQSCRACHDRERRFSNKGCSFHCSVCGVKGHTKRNHDLFAQQAEAR
jgi:hypothetical protein